LSKTYGFVGMKVKEEVRTKIREAATKYNLFVSDLLNLLLTDETYLNRMMELKKRETSFA
jgi:antitoxin component of RelBE/YafQ-DinJ toxin-antitoxin module